jgi:SAM-dependent methyltransferase
MSAERKADQGSNATNQSKHAERRSIRAALTVATNSPASNDWSKSALGLGLARPPWTPCAEDGDLLLDALRPHLTDSGAVSLVALLGVTPALTQLGWPDGARVLAVDASPAIIRSQWRAHSTVPSAVTCARWQALPLPDKSVAAVAGDGSLNTLAYTAYQDLFREVARVLAPESVFILRCFVRPDTRGDVDDITRDVAKQAFPNSAPFRLRLCMTLCEADGTLVLGTLLERFNGLFPDRAKLASLADWPIDEVDRFDMDRDSKIQLTFPTLSELAAHAEPLFAIREVRHGSYDLAELCPTITFVPSQSRQRLAR